MAFQEQTSVVAATTGSAPGSVVQLTLKPIIGPLMLTGLRPSPTRHAVDRCRFERKLSQGPAVRWADRHHSLRR